MKRIELILRAVFFIPSVIICWTESGIWMGLKARGKAKDCLIVWLWKHFVTEYDKH